MDISRTLKTEQVIKVRPNEFIPVSESKEIRIE